MIDWNDLHHFVVLAREGTLSAAARALHVDHVTVARRVAALEAATALKLVDRRARSYALTDDGRRIATAASTMVEAAFAVGRAAQTPAPVPRIGILWPWDQTDVQRVTWSTAFTRGLAELPRRGGRGVWIGLLRCAP